MKVLILRPEPGAGETAAKARALGLEPVVAPLFTIRPLAWESPDPAAFDAVILTSANAARYGGDGMTPFLALLCYAVGGRTAEEARRAGFANIRTGAADGRALIAMARKAGIKSAIHFCGRDHIAFGEPVVAEIPVYAAELVDGFPSDAEAAIALFHSPRAAVAFAERVNDRAATHIVAISPQTAEAAGGGWKSIHVAAAPTDQALLELAAQLCQSEDE